MASGALSLDRRTRRAYVGSEELRLTPKALALLEYLMTHPDELLTRDRLLDTVWRASVHIRLRAFSRNRYVARFPCSLFVSSYTQF